MPNPVKDRLVANPVDWAWSSSSFYETEKIRIVRIDFVD